MSEPREELRWMAPEEVRRLENRRWYCSEVRRRADPVLRRLLAWAVVITVGFWAVIGSALGDLELLPFAREPGGLLRLAGGLGAVAVVSAPCFWLLWWLDDRARWICLAASLTAAFAVPGLLGWMRSMGAPTELMLLVVWCLFPATLLVPWLADGPVDDFRGRLRTMIGRHAEARANRTGARLRMEVFAYDGLSLAVGAVFILRRLAESVGAT